MLLKMNFLFTLLLYIRFAKSTQRRLEAEEIINTAEELQIATKEYVKKLQTGIDHIKNDATKRSKNIFPVFLSRALDFSNFEKHDLSVLTADEIQIYQNHLKSSLKELKLIKCAITETKSQIGLAAKTKKMLEEREQIVTKMISLIQGLLTESSKGTGFISRNGKILVIVLLVVFVGVVYNTAKHLWNRDY